MMKIMVLLFAVLIAGNALAAATEIVDCRVAKIYDDNVFEEGLSTHEYPDVALSKTGKDLVLSLGAMRNYQTKTGDAVSYHHKASQLVVHAAYKNNDRGVLIKVAGKANASGKKWGKLYVFETANSSPKEVALLICKSESVR